MTNHLSWRYIILLQTRKEIRIFNILLNIFRYWLSLIKINSSRIKHRVLTFIIEADDGGEIQLTFIIEADDGGEIQLMLTRQLRNNLFFSIFLIDAGGADLKANLFVAILPSELLRFSFAVVPQPMLTVGYEWSYLHVKRSMLWWVNFFWKTLIGCC